MIRPFAESDLAAVLSVEQACTDFPWSMGQFQSSVKAGHFCQCLELDGQLVGFSIFSLVLDEACLLNIAVRPDCQAKGFGRQLLESGLAWCVSQGAQSCYLEVRLANQSAQGLYRAMGFQQVGKRKAYYPAERGREDALIMSRALPLATVGQA